ncbi:MAG: hypothetical protein V2G33_07090 [bacterium JZ-2024 1]
MRWRGLGRAEPLCSRTTLGGLQARNRLWECPPRRQFRADRQMPGLPMKHNPTRVIITVGRSRKVLNACPKKGENPGAMPIPRGFLSLRKVTLALPPGKGKRGQNAADFWRHLTDRGW